MEWDDQCAVENTEIGCFSSHVAEAYTITYKAVDGIEQTLTVADDASEGLRRGTTLINLISNTEYTFTIQIDGHGTMDYEVFSDVSQSEIGITSRFCF